ncbi:site-specific DNA-methyltransferase [Clostridium sp. AM58-1XD]|uniref:site-specific DNA-methyltransferase n=1 Tax=Clostridium sp. AM58-1XD TaxID=2292307 RepID=UPI000E469BB3|nr:site-specific DNA-methyltransferase [Clostridium sp. AM58-1XD]RGZ01285.1 site-specific DNA-methyltransferase [Clostridium sp. AM58-1XD]
MNDKLQRFINLMRSVFELDKSDLDFGIYRIMNIRNAEIEKFLTEGLPEKVQEALAPYANEDKSKIKQQMEDIENNAKQFGFDDISSLPENNPMAQKYADLQRQLVSGTDMSALETDVYSALYSFFNRYYDEGDFISKRRYKEGVYAIPYEGEEVKLYWANQDQYYIKTSENFKDYTFVEDNITVHFRLVEATVEQNNNKEAAENKRTFMLYTPENARLTPEEFEAAGFDTFSWNEETKELIIRFIFDIPTDKKRRYDAENYDGIVEYLMRKHKDVMRSLLRNISPDKKRELTVLEKQLKNYVAKNTFDYFIHKDLHSFLSRELDFYIKSEVMQLDDLDTENERQVDAYLAKVRAIKRVGKVIIDFLSQIEEFQKKLWLKKKFVVQTDWCITLDRIATEFWEEICANKAQTAEWIAMFAIDQAKGWTNPPTAEFLRQNQNLIVDTALFSTDFKERLLAAIDNLDEQTDGVLIKSDNFQALQLLTERYSGKIRLEYIDPPYNTDASKILYKNGYEHSSWISLMDSRLEAGRRLLSSNGIIEVAIDDYEMRYLSLCLDQIFGSGNAISNIAILTNPKGRDQGFIAQAHDYTLMYAKNKVLAETNNFILTPEELAKKFSKSKDGEALRELPLKRTGTGKRREERPYMYFPFFFAPKSKELFVIPEKYYKKIYDADTQTFNDDYLQSVIDDYAERGYEAVLPVSSQGELFRWRWGYQSCVKGVENGTLFCKPVRSGGYAIYQYDFANNEATPKSLWFGERYDASSKGTNLLENMIPKNPFDYPKSLYTVMDNIIIGSDSGDTVLDYFAGSGTTGHAVIELNRTVKGAKRKYVLVDMGEYFETVTKTRIEKAAYCAEWKNGVPVNRNTGVSQIIKYMRLESYEDALSNIQMANEDAGLHALLGEQYLVHYMLDLGKRGSLMDIDSFQAPFDYKLMITEKNECRLRRIDLCETFNYLIGLLVVRQSAVTYYRSVKADTPSYEGAVDLIEDIDGQYAFKQIEGILPDHRRVLIIWRTVTNDLLASNAALDAFYLKYCAGPSHGEYDVIYVNCDNNLENLRTDRDSWNVRLTESEFKRFMFEEV